MKTLALLVLAIVWVALIATWLRSRAQDGGFEDPVGTFNRHLRVLERAAPSRYAPANRRQSAVPRADGHIAPYRPPPSAGIGPRTHPPARAGRVPMPRKTQSQKRRRDVFFALLAGVIGSLVLGIIPGLHAMLYVQVAFDVLMAAYIALLIRMRNLAAERQMKLSYMSTRRPPARSAQYVGAGQVAYSGYAMAAGGHDAYRSDDGYGVDDTYGDLVIRPTAN